MQSELLEGQLVARAAHELVAVNLSKDERPPNLPILLNDAIEF